MDDCMPSQSLQDLSPRRDCTRLRQSDKEVCREMRRPPPPRGPRATHRKRNRSSRSPFQFGIFPHPFQTRDGIVVAPRIGPPNRGVAPRSPASHLFLLPSRLRGEPAFRATPRSRSSAEDASFPARLPSAPLRLCARPKGDTSKLPRSIPISIPIPISIAMYSLFPATPGEVNR